MQPKTQLMIDLLAAGHTQREVALILEVTDSAVSQVNSEYAAQIDDKRMERGIVSKNLDDKYDELEMLALEQLEEKMPFETSVRNLVAAASMFNAAKRRSGPRQSEQATTATNNFIQINIGAAAAQRQEFRRDHHGRVVEVNGRSLTPASNEQVEAELEMTLEHREVQHETPNKTLELTCEDFEPSKS